MYVCICIYIYIYVCTSLSLSLSTYVCIHVIRSPSSPYTFAHSSIQLLTKPTSKPQTLTSLKPWKNRTESKSTLTTLRGYLDPPPKKKKKKEKLHDSTRKASALIRKRLPGSRWRPEVRRHPQWLGSHLQGSRRPPKSERDGLGGKGGGGRFC